MKREANFTLVFRHWLKANPMISGAFELKQTQSNALAFDQVKEHQLEALMAVRHAKTGFLYKAPDDSRGVKPFDMFYLKSASAYVVIKYPGEFSMIDIDTFLLEKQRSKRKSLTCARAREISIISIKN